LPRSPFFHVSKIAYPLLQALMEQCLAKNTDVVLGMTDNDAAGESILFQVGLLLLLLLLLQLLSSCCSCCRRAAAVVVVVVVVAAVLLLLLLLLQLLLLLLLLRWDCCCCAVIMHSFQDCNSQRW